MNFVARKDPAAVRSIQNPKNRPMISSLPWNNARNSLIMMIWVAMAVMPKTNRNNTPSVSDAVLLTLWRFFSS